MNLAWLLLLAIPEDPAIALEQLGRYGPAPECEVQERIDRSGDEHSHVFSPPPAIPAFEGIYEEVAPYLDHANRDVVLRAVALICRTGNLAAGPRLAALARKWPCENAVTRAASTLSLEALNLPQCTESRDRPWQLSVQQLLKAKQPKQRATARAISAGDATALTRTVWRLGAIDSKAQVDAFVTLAQVDTAAAFLPTAKEVQRAMGTDFSRGLQALVDGLFSAQLEGIKKGDRLGAFLEVCGSASVDDAPLLRDLESRFRFDRDKVSAAAEVQRGSKTLTPFGRAWLESLAARRDPWRSKDALSKMSRHRDRPALRAFIADDANLLVSRFEAAELLAKLGDATGLVLYESTEGLWREERADRRRRLVELATQARSPAREAAEALLEKTWPPPPT